MSLDSGSATRTYNPNVRVGNWNEEICLEDDMLKDFLEKQEAGTLLIQRTQSLMQTLLKKTELTSSETVSVGTNIMLINPGRSGIDAATADATRDRQMQNLPRQLLAGRIGTSISVNVDEWPVGGLQTLVQQPLALAGASNTDTPCVRNTFKLVSMSKPAGEELNYGDKFVLQSVLGEGELNKNLFVFTDRLRLGQSVAANRKISGVAPLQLVPYEKSDNIPYGAFWQVDCFDPLLRMEHEGLPVPKNSPILLRHCSTGQHLAVLDDSSFRTPFGHEITVGAKTYFNSHKAEQDNNYWLFQ